MSVPSSKREDDGAARRSVIKGDIVDCSNGLLLPLQFLPTLSSVRILRLNNNALREIPRLRYTTISHTIEVLELRANDIASLDSLVEIVYLTQLNSLDLRDNPLCSFALYRDQCIPGIKHMCPSIAYIDGEDVSAISCATGTFAASSLPLCSAIHDIDELLLQFRLATSSTVDVEECLEYLDACSQSGGGRGLHLSPNRMSRLSPRRSQSEPVLINAGSTRPFRPPPPELLLLEHVSKLGGVTGPDFLSNLERLASIRK
jgi:Leucine-rich repeat (LRR) protein